MSQDVLLRLEGITKQFPGVKALDCVDLDVLRGEVHAIVGENGAGKSTLIKIIAGAYRKDSGKLFLDGEEIENNTPQISLKKGVSVIYQELSYLGPMSIAENIFLGSQSKTKANLIDYRTMMEKSMKVQETVGLGHYNPRTEVRFLSTAEKQLIEIARAYTRDLKLLILDEPTSALNEVETERLFGIIKTLREKGCGIIYITHKMDEIFRIADRVTVMRDGRHIITKNIKDTNRDEIITAMVGREITDLYPVMKRTRGDIMLSVDGLNSGILKNVSINVRSGEIVGLYGLMGCGSDRLLECIFGKRPVESGSITIKGRTIEIGNPRRAIAQGIAYAPSERKTEGLMLSQSVYSNISCVTLGKIRKHGILDLKREKEIARSWVERLRIKTPTVETPVVSLSGGNQQKVILARWLENNPTLFLMNEPTKGIDVGARAEIYAQMEKICEQGSSVVFVTSDLPELLGISDRVYVFHEGVMTGEITGEELTQENVVKKAIGE